VSENEVQERSLVIVEDEGYLGKPINRDIVVEFGDTLMGIHPAAKEVGVIGMRSVAQLALVTGASPMPGTNGIHAWADNKGIHIQFGIGFWRGEAEKMGGILWLERPRPMTEEEREAHEVAQGQTAFICSGALRSAVVSLIKEMKELGINLTLQEAKNEVGQTGTSIVNAQEYNKAGRSKGWTGELRAERDLLRKLVPVMQRVRDNLEHGTYEERGQGWELASYANQHRPELQVPEDYDEDDANRELFGIEPDIEDGIIIEESKGDNSNDQQKVAQETAPAEAEKVSEEPVAEIPVEELEKMAVSEENAWSDDEIDIYDSNSHEEWLRTLKQRIPRYQETAHVHNALKAIGLEGGLNDLPYITGRDKIEENIKAKRERRLEVYRMLVEREENKE